MAYAAAEGGRLMNFRLNEHDTAHPAGRAPLMAMDAFERAYMVDYGLERADYIEAFFTNVNWEQAESRLQ